MSPRTLLIAALVAAATGCAYTPQVVVTAGARAVNGETSPGACLALIQRFEGGRLICSYTHCSDPAKGRPFNAQFDVSDDVLGCGASWGGQRR